MTEMVIIKLLRDSLMITLIVSAPILLVGMLVGLVIAIFQTTTSIQEQTLTFVPKIVTIFVTLILLWSWMSRMLTDYTFNVFDLIGRIGSP
ncbi:MAG: flagellar biosynthesis protein FliQ [Spirochaetia bacterium]|jgi:flagellar biosynthetic protein FliQ|nr:flagellar biosynthesis protein FliQ [Spirochaetia bacterium]